MSLHLAEISTQVTPGSIGAIICDGAGWHAQGDTLEVPGNTVLVSLPSYAPELNSMENVWEHLHGNKLSARVWDTYEEILAARADEPDADQRLDPPLRPRGAPAGRRQFLGQAGWAVEVRCLEPFRGATSTLWASWKGRRRTRRWFKRCSTT
jgi:hypothetical protein